MALAHRLSPKQRQRVARVLTHIDTHLSGNLTLTGLAEVAGCSRWQLQRAFAELDLTLAAYVRQRRLNQAAWLLRHTPDRQRDIASACGFESDIQFHRAFKAHFCMTPGQYRRIGQPFKEPVNEPVPKASCWQPRPAGWTPCSYTIALRDSQ